MHVINKEEAARFKEITVQDKQGSSATISVCESRMVKNTAEHC